MSARPVSWHTARTRLFQCRKHSSSAYNLQTITTQWMIQGSVTSKVRKWFKTGTVPGTGSFPMAAKANLSGGIREIKKAPWMSPRRYGHGPKLGPFPGPDRSRWPPRQTSWGSIYETKQRPVDVAHAPATSEGLVFTTWTAMCNCQPADINGPPPEEKRLLN